MTQILQNIRVKAKLLIKYLCRKYFPQPLFACSKLTIETLEQHVKIVINKDTRTTSLT